MGRIEKVRPGLKQIVPVVNNPESPNLSVGTNILTSPIHVLDLGLTLPLSILSVVWRWQKKSWMCLLAGLLIIMMTLETNSILMNQYSGHIHSRSASSDAIQLFHGLSIISLIVTLVFMGIFNTKSNSQKGRR